MLGRMQWKRLPKYVRNVRKNAMKTSSKGKSEMLGRMQWNHLAKVIQKCKNINDFESLGKNAMKNLSKGKSEMLGRMQWRMQWNRSISQKY